MVILYIFPFWYVWTKKNLATLRQLHSLSKLAQFQSRMIGKLGTISDPFLSLFIQGGKSFFQTQKYSKQKILDLQKTFYSLTISAKLRFIFIHITYSTIQGRLIELI
jgi:hypothetical protein